MKALTSEQCLEWFESHGYSKEGQCSGQSNSLKLDFSKASEIPAARNIIDQLRTQGSILLWIKNWSDNSIFVHFPLFQRFCDSIGLEGDLSQYPAMLFEPEERDDALAALILALHFSWELSLFASNGVAQTHIVDNDYCFFVSTQAEYLASAKSELSDWLA